MKCSYKLNNKTITSQDLVMEFMKQNNLLASGSIFSSEDVQNSAIRTLLTHAQVGLDPTKTTEEKTEYTPLKELITKPNRNLFDSLGTDVWNLAERLAPEFIEENWITEEVKSSIAKEEEVPEDWTGVNVEVDETLYNKIISLAMFTKEDYPKVKYFQHKAEEVIKEDKKMQRISRMLHAITSDVIGKNNIGSFDNVFDNHFGERVHSVFGEDTEENRNKWKEAMRKVVAEIKKTVEAYGYPLGNLELITHPDSKVHISGKIDLVAISENGTPFIFEVAVSRKPYNSWNSAKVLTTDWESTMKRQLIGQSLPIQEAQSFIIPVIVGGPGDFKHMSVDDIQHRTHADMSRVGANNLMSEVAEAILPSRIVIEYDPRRLRRMESVLKATLSEEYNIKTEFGEDNVDSIMKSSEKKFNQTGIWRRHNAYPLSGLPEWMTVTPASDSKEDQDKAKEEFKAMIEVYVNYVRGLENKEVSLIQDAFVTALNNNQDIKTSKSNSNKDDALNKLLGEYLNDNWEVIPSPEAKAMGLFVLRSKTDNEINIFNISTSQAYASFKKDKSHKYLHGDLDAIKAMIFLNEFYDKLFPNNSYKLGNIITFNPRNGESYPKTVDVILDMFKERMHRAGLSNDIKMSETDLIDSQDLALKTVYKAMRNYDGRYKKKIEDITEVFGNKHLQDIDKEMLIQVRERLLKEFPTYINRTVNPEINFDDGIEVILALLQVAILTKEGVDPAGDFQNLTMYSLQAADFKSLLHALYTQDVVEYDKTGKKVQWLIGGMAWTNPEFVQSKDLRQINSLISTGNSSIRERMVYMNEKTRGHTQKYFEAIEYNTFQRMTVGNTQDQHRNLYLLDENGSPTTDFRTKNPYSSDPENALETYEAEYLKELLLIINQYKLGISDKEIDSLDANSYASISSNDAIAKALETGDYFKMPLIRKEGMGKYKDAFQSHGDRWRLLNMAKDKFDSFLDQRELSEQDVENIEAEQLGFFEMYDVYGNQSNDRRAKMIEERGANYFELNLDTIAHRVAFSKIRKQTFDMILPTVNAYMWWIKLVGGKQNVDVSKQLKYITNQIKLAVFDEPLVNDEQKTLAAGISFARQLTTTMMLAFRPALLAKEMTIGVLKNFSAAALGINEEFTAKEMTKAYEKLMTIDNKFTDEFNLINRLNQFYGMANMDTATVPGKLQTDRWGITKGLGNYMFMTSTVGDYYNRMAVLMSKMIKDGSYDAHSMKGGKMIYDPTKDERYSYYLANRDKYKSKNGAYMPKKGDTKFNEQRRAYLLTIDQINKEGAVLNSKKLDEKDMIPKAYSHKQRDSIKSYADLMYGAYDKDWQAQIGHTLYGLAFMQFLTFWPSKMRFYFGKPISEEDSPQGKMSQEYIVKEDGTREMQWWETTENEDGSIERNKTSENTGDPVLKWEGTMQEGVFVSLMYSVQDILRGNWDKLKTNKLRRNRAMFAIADGFMIGFILSLINMMLKGAKEELGRESISGELLHFAEVTGRKVIGEYDVFDNTFGAIRTEPLALAKSMDIARGVYDTMIGNKDLRTLMGQSIGAFEFLK